METEPNSHIERIPTGTAGFDEVLRGGLAAGRAYLILGEPGTGKTTLALQFAREGVRLNDRVLYVTLSQDAEALHQIAASHGWTLDGIDVQEPNRADASRDPASRQHAIHPADIELVEVVDQIGEMIDALRPDRLVLDAIGVLRTMAAGQAHRYHSEVASLVRHLQRSGTTSMVVGPADSGFREDGLASAADAEVHMLFHGSIRLIMDAPPYGSVRRSIRVEKARGMNFNSGWHNCEIRRGGFQVFPRLNVGVQPGEAFQTPDLQAENEWLQMKSGVEELDTMLGGGLEFGTTTIIVGATGTGKSTLALQYTYAALRQGRKAAVFLFTERASTYAARSKDLRMDIGPYLSDSLLHLESVDVGELSPGGLADRLRNVVDAGARVVAIDSLTGYHHSMRNEALLQVQMHEMLRFLAQRGVLALLVVDQHGIVGNARIAPVDVSYMCDSLIVLRNYDEAGRIRRAIAVVKKRYGDHDMAVRELEITSGGLRIGDARPELAGVLSGSPTIMRREESPSRAAGGNEDEE